MFKVGSPCESCRCPGCASYELCKELFCPSCRRAGRLPVDNCRYYDKHEEKIGDGIRGMLKD